MTDRDDGACRSTETTSGDPCQNPAESCPWHGTDGDAPETGRPTKLSHARQEQIAQALEAGGSFKAACEAAGIAPKTGHRWMERGENQDDGEFHQFRQRVTRA